MYGLKGESELVIYIVCVLGFLFEFFVVDGYILVEF